jgi:RNA 3'-terminal phosphate cyclase (ATP)
MENQITELSVLLHNDKSLLTNYPSWELINGGNTKFINDGLTCTRINNGIYNGTIGSNIYTEDSHHFAIQVHNPTDDTFWIGVAYLDVSINEAPKHNTKTIIWSGGNETRPGTVRIHSEKRRNMPKYEDGDVIGIVVDMKNRDLIFYKNGNYVMYWEGIIQGPCRPYFLSQFTDSSATLIQWNGPNLPLGKQIVNRNFKDIENRNVVNENQQNIDCSLLEGGGQTIRINMGLSALLRMPIKIHSIRAKRSKPGLGHQHSTSAKLVADLCEGILDPKELLYGSHLTGVTELCLYPGIENNTATEFIADIHTAGSVALLLQTALPCALLNRSNPSKLILKGGTNVSFSPSCDFMKMVFFPHLVKMGINHNSINFNIEKRGYYPRGGGEFIVDVQPIKSINAIDLVDRGEVVSIRGIVYGGGGGVNIKALKNTKIIVGKLLKELFDVTIDIQYSEVKDIKSKIVLSTNENITKKDKEKIFNDSEDRYIGTCGIQLLLETSTGCIISGNSIIENAKTKETIYPDNVAKEAVSSLLENWNAGGCVDEFIMDQLIIYMALAHGHSRVLCNGVTNISSQHLETAIYFTKLMTGVDFTITETLGEYGKMCKLVECDGMCYVNKWL